MSLPACGGGWAGVGASTLAGYTRRGCSCSRSGLPAWPPEPYTPHPTSSPRP